MKRIDLIGVDSQGIPSQKYWDWAKTKADRYPMGTCFCVETIIN